MPDPAGYPVISRCRIFVLWAILLLLAHPAVALEVKLNKHAGVYHLPASINGVITLEFVLDSGAAEVAIPADVVLTLLRTGTVAQEDFLPGKSYTLADGSRLRGPRFIIRTLDVGGYNIHQVVALVAPVAGDLLLGQSFLERFHHWTLDNQHGRLILEPKDPLAAQTDAEDVKARARENPTTAGSPTELITSYYDDLQNKRTTAAMAKWKQAPPNLATLIQKIQEIRLNRAVLVEEGLRVARISVEVVGKTADGEPERWVGMITLEKLAGIWKIAKMQLHRE